MGNKSVKMEEGPSDVIIPIEEGSIQCNAPNQTATFVDNVSCLFFQLPYFMDKIKFGQISSAIVFIVTVTAAAKSIKRPKNLYLFNVLLFDLSICYEFLTNRKIDNNGFQNCHVGLNRFVTYNTHFVNKLPPLALLQFIGFKILKQKSPKFWKTFFCKKFRIHF